MSSPWSSRKNPAIAGSRSTPGMASPSAKERRSNPEQNAVAGGGEHDGADVDVRLGLQEGRTQFDGQRWRQRVARLGPIEPHDLDRPSAFADEVAGGLTVGVAGGLAHTCLNLSTRNSEPVVYDEASLPKWSAAVVISPR